MWRIIRIALVIYVLANLLAAFIFWPRIDQFLRFMPRVAPSDYSAPVTTLEAQIQDISYLETILNYDRSFSDGARARFKSRINDFKQKKKEQNAAQFYLTVRELMALADNGHTGVSAVPAIQDFNRSGIDIYNFSDGYYVVRAHKNHGIMVGHKVIAIDGKPIEKIVEGLRIFTGGAENWRDQQSLRLLRSPELLHAAGLAARPDAITITIKGAGGQETKATLEALPAAGEINYFRHAFMTLSPDTLGEEEKDWARTLYADKDDVAPYLSDMQNNVLSLPIGNGLYVRSNYLLGSREFPVKKLLLDSLENAPEQGFEHIIVDLRWNPGGDYGNAIPFAKAAKSTLSDNGKIYVLTSTNTFSAAIVFTALLKQNAPEQVLIVGEAMGDRPQFWAERGKPFILPNSNYWIGYSTGFHDWIEGCASTHTYCFPPNKKWEKRIDDLQVDHALTPSYAEYASGRDFVMDWVLANKNR